MARRDFKKLTLKNGLRVILVPQPGLAASVLILVEAGSEYETKKINGISHFLEHMMFKGTVSRPKVGQIAEELASLGAQSNAFTSQEYTGYWAKAERHKLPKILDIVSDLYLNPIFNPEEIEKERGVIVEELHMRNDDPMTHVQTLFMNLLYGDQPAGWDIVGKKEIIRKVTRNDFLRYRGANYVSKKTVVVIAGYSGERQVLEQIRSRFGGLKRRGGPVKPRTRELKKRSALHLHFKESDQSHLVLGMRAFDIFDKRRYALQVLSDVLGGGMSSRLFHKVREEMGAAYYVSAGADFFLDHGLFAVSAGVAHVKIEAVLKAILDELRRISREPVPPKELQKSKDHLVGNLILNLETSDELAGFYGEQEVLSRRILPPAELIAKIQGVAVEEVRSAARTVFKNDKLRLAVIGPYRNARLFHKVLKL